MIKTNPMKHLCLVICILLTGQLMAQKSVDKFINKKMKSKIGYAVTLPGWMFKSTGKIASKFDNEDDVAKYWSLTQYVKNFRGYMYEGDLDQGEVQSLIKHLRDKDGYEEYVTIRDGGSNVNVFVKENDTHIRGMVFLVNSDDTFAIARLKTKLPFEVFEELNYTNL